MIIPEKIKEGLDETKSGSIGAVGDINVLKKIILSVLSNLEDTKYKTEIIKLCFILDYEYCKKFNSNIGPTTVAYIKYNYGPYSDSFIDAFEQLVNEGLLIQVSLPFGLGYALKEKAEIKNDDKTEQILREVIEKFGKSSLREMKSFIYEREEFKKTEFGKMIIFN